MTNTRSQINELKNSQQKIPSLLITKLALTNAMRAFYCTGGMLINANYANNGVLDRILNKLNHYFQHARSKSKTNGVSALLKILGSIQIAYAITLYGWDATDSYGPNTANHKAIQWVWCIFMLVNLQVFYKDVSRSALRSFFLQNEAPFCLVRVKNISYKVLNPNFKGKKFSDDELEKNDVATLNSLRGILGDQNGAQTWNLIQEKIEKGQFKPIESKNGVVDNDFGLRSWLVRGGIGLALSMISFSSGVALRILPSEDKSLFGLFKKYNLAALSDLNALYVGLIPFIQPIIMQKLIKSIALPHVLNNGKIDKKRQVLRGALISFASLNVTFLFYSGYRLVYDEILSVKILKNPSVNFINNYNNTVGDSAITRTINGATNEWVANGFLGMGILSETFTFYVCVDSLMSSLEFFKNSPRRKAMACQILLICMTGMIIAGVPLDQMAPQYFFDLAYGILFTMAAKFQYNFQNQEKGRRVVKDIDYIDEINGEYQDSQQGSGGDNLLSNDDNINDSKEDVNENLSASQISLSYGPTDKDR